MPAQVRAMQPETRYAKNGDLHIAIIGVKA